MENLFLAWKEFKKGKSSKGDIQDFEFNLEENIFQLHKELKGHIYRHSPYTAFYVTDPKLRHIHKAMVRDRVVHHAIFRILYPIFDKNFIYDSYSCRLGKGTHRGVDRLELFLRKASRNSSKNVYALKCDIRKFFDSIDKDILIEMIRNKIKNSDTMRLISIILGSFSKESGKGLPLGNVTSQIFANIYLNELDQYVKHHLKHKYYIRYCDDFVILGYEQNDLYELVYKISEFLEEHLNLNLHPNKIILRKYRQRVDFLGYVVSPYHRALRTKTKNRATRNIIEKRHQFESGLITEDSYWQSLNSYLGMLDHCDGYELEKELIWLSGLAEVEF